MNSSQLQSLVRLLLNTISGAIIAWTATKSAPTQNVGDFLAKFITGPDVFALALTFVAWLWGHVNHSTPTVPEQPAGPAAPISPRLTGPLMILLLGCGLWTVDCGLLTGCSSTPQQVAYQSAGTTIVTVDTAMGLWGAYVAANQPGTNAEAKVKFAYEKYQTAMTILCDAGTVYSMTASTNAASVLNLAASTAAQDLLDLENLITACGVKLTP
jgi:hypothetical protein